jgi:hypothetical protein
MKSLIAGFILVVLGSCVYGAAETAEKVSPIAPEVQLVSKDLAARVVEKDLVFGDSWWPTDAESRKVSAARIPEKVLARTTTWLRTMIKPQWLPQDPNAWMTGVQKEKPLRADYLILRYRIGAVSVQIQEDGSAARVLIDTGAFTEGKPEAFLTAVIRKFLRYPEDKLDTLKFYLENFEHEGKTISYGTVDCDFNRDDTEAYFKRNWYHHTFVWTDGRRAFFSLVEGTGQPAQHKQVRPGIRPRFKPAE